MEMSKVNILLIEDNEVDVRLLNELLNNAREGKYGITTTVTLKGGLAQLADNKFDVVLTELNLPDTDGVNTITLIQEQDSSVPIIVRSGQDSEELALQVVQMGAQDYLVKGQGDGLLISRSIEYSIERKRNEQGLSYLANYDSLTGLANRLLFRERLDRALIRADRNKNLVALLVIDLDRFKNINDTLGHDAGDKLLVEVAGRLEQCTREGDTIARLGGDEFTIIMEDVKAFEDAVKIVDKILNRMKNSFDLLSREIFVSPSVGISMYPLDDTDAGNLLKNADSAMYSAKEGGRNCYRFYTSGMNKKLLLNLNMEAKLRRAIERHEFVLNYQPKFDINTHELLGAEALIRWHCPGDGVISPAVFIPLAEESGLIGVITDWVIKEACRQNSEWQQEGYAPIRMAINISPRQFAQENIARRIFNQIICSDLAPKYVELEITEGALMDDVEKSNEILKELKARGIHISIDDFGTGYSSLSYLKKFHINTLKIDQTFVRDIMEDTDDAAIVSAIIAMAKSLRLNVIAEGVETSEQLNYLAAKGCNEAQGYLLGKPVTAKEFTKFFDNNVVSPTIKLVQSA
jgi:diguanylate cyclase (GGDEF)-like protein